jgi:hypothetical protein
MGLFDWFTGTKSPAAGVAPVSAAEMRAAILGVNRGTAPFVVAEDTSGKADLVAEWRIVDANWYVVFGKAHLDKTARVLMRLDPGKHEVRSVDEMWSVEWVAGVPNMSLSAEAFRGQKKEISFGRAWAFTEEFRPGEVYNYRFDTSELKTPLQKAVTEHGWTWRGVSFGKL